MPIVVEQLSYIYNPKSPFEKKALDNISFTINEGEFVGIVGCTGSGKSTLVKHLNGLIKLTSGKITVFDIDLTVRKPDYKLLRKSIGMLFQYPEYQLFDSTVLKDVCFGPKNFGMSEQEAYESAKRAIGLVGLDFDDIKDRSPFEISGGQKRRVAMAGVLAYNPQILVLDEPTAGLDPSGKREMLDLISGLRKSGNVKTVIMISHNMDEIAEYTDRILLLNEGKLHSDCAPSELFERRDELVNLGLDAPNTVKIKELLREKGFATNGSALNVESLYESVKELLGRKHG